MESSDQEANIFLVENHEDDEVTSYFTYDELFYICKKLNKESRKLKHIIYASKTTISSLEIDTINSLKEIDSLKERQHILIKSSSFFEDPIKPTKYEQYNVL